MTENISTRKIESPLSSFNNILSDITKNLEHILFPKKLKLAENNQIIFDNKNIIIMGYIKLGLLNDELHLKINKPINKSDQIFLSNLLLNWDNVSLEFFRYFQMYNNIANNFDDIPYQLVDSVISNINYCLRTNNNQISNLLIPYKKKISKLYDSDKEYLVNFYNRFEYILKINIVNKTNFEYLVFRVLSSELSENKNELNNLRYQEQDLIKKGNLKIHQIENFIQKLFYYGEIISN